MDGGSRPGEGGAGLLSLDHRTDAVVVKAKAYGGSHRFSGRDRDAKSLLGHALWQPDRATEIWGTMQAHQRDRTDDIPEQFLGRLRLGTRWIDQAIEIEAQSDLDRQGSLGEERESRRTELKMGTWFQRGSAVASVDGGVGRVAERRGRASEGDGELYSASLGLRGPLGPLRTTGRLDHRWMRNPFTSQGIEESRLALDLHWAARDSRALVGVGLTHDRTGWPGPGGGHHRSEARAQAEWRVRPGLSLRTDAAVRRDANGSTLDRWELQLQWAARDVLPLPWTPSTDRMRAVVFLDENLDGRLGAGEATMPGVVLRVDGRTIETGPDGRVTFPEPIGGSYRVEVHPTSLAGDLIPRDAFPREIAAAAGVSAELLVPLVRAAGLAGVVYHDRNRNGTRDPSEEGVANVRIELLREGQRVAGALTAADGSYRFPRVPPGPARLAVAEGWMPPGWEEPSITHQEVNLESGREARAPDFGLAPVERPMRRTFHGTSGRQR